MSGEGSHERENPMTQGERGNTAHHGEDTLDVLKSPGRGREGYVDGLC